MRNEEKKVNRFIMIPKIIHLCWLSGDPYPPKIQKCLESWKKFLPEYEVMLWDGNRFDLNSSSWVAQACSKNGSDRRKYINADLRQRQPDAVYVLLGQECFYYG